MALKRHRRRRSRSEVREELGEALLRHVQQHLDDTRRGRTDPVASAWGTSIDLGQLLEILTATGEIAIGKHVTLRQLSVPTMRIVDRGDVSRWEITARRPLLVVQWGPLRVRSRIDYLEFARDLSRVSVGLHRLPDWPIELLE